MCRSSHFNGQLLYGLVIKLPDKSNILRSAKSKEGGGRYTKHFNSRNHLVVIFYAMFMRHDSMCRITTSLMAEARKLAHFGINIKIGRSTLADTNKGILSDIRFTSAATNDSFMLKPTTLNNGHRPAYIDYEKFKQLT
ncbi:MAG: DUF4372 domain-containing protein [Bacteroides sp.]|nr:DUF4372 domain-containing protein [Roseburia sp.]MCM1345834.1 DUF4372 domain-containing protein [Bacteroides sp.]MCM1420224.1 DUF4372 domain-containing protein [Bacteroides sp.]